MDLETQLLFALEDTVQPIPLTLLTELVGYPERTVRMTLSGLLRRKEVYWDPSYKGYTRAKAKPPQECIFLEIATMRDGSKVWACEFFTPKLGEQPVLLTLERAKQCRKGEPCSYKGNGRR